MAKEPGKIFLVFFVTGLHSDLGLWLVCLQALLAALSLKRLPTSIEQLCTVVVHQLTRLVSLFLYSTVFCHWSLGLCSLITVYWIPVSWDLGLPGLAGAVSLLSAVPRFLPGSSPLSSGSPVSHLSVPPRSSCLTLWASPLVVGFVSFVYSFCVYASLFVC